MVFLREASLANRSRSVLGARGMGSAIARLVKYSQYSAFCGSDVRHLWATCESILSEPMKCSNNHGSTPV
ncbi:MAG: hypothetical protein F6K16_31125 [Symploca sp. SIO2B6]|nr:hypothetical protein [Symploca sp. SIO2B6]